MAAWSESDLRAAEREHKGRLSQRRLFCAGGAGSLQRPLQRNTTFPRFRASFLSGTGSHAIYLTSSSHGLEK